MKILKGAVVACVGAFLSAVNEALSNPGAFQFNRAYVTHLLLGAALFGGYALTTYVLKSPWFNDKANDSPAKPEAK